MIKTDVKVNIDYTFDGVKGALCRVLPISENEVKNLFILKKSLKIEDGNVYYSLSVAAELSSEREEGLLKMKKKVSPCPVYDFSVPERSFSSRPVVVGAGPAGLFAALTLALSGANPIVIERGRSVEERIISKNVFFENKILDEESNVQFGEGGAGAFSDGKLKVGSMDKYKHFVLSSFVEAGAPEDILYTVGAHLGTDKLPLLVSSIRGKIKALGGEFIYSARVYDIEKKNGKLCAVLYRKDGKDEKIETDTCVLAAGHSAKDTFEMLLSHGVPMQRRGFGIGVRIEHPREYVNELVYKEKTLADKVGTASYHLVTHLPTGRSVYSFCMCPGGTVVAAASEGGGVVTNGMSEYLRMDENSNAAFLVSVTPADFESDSLLAGIELQRKIERLAYGVGGGDFTAPAIRMEDFMKKANEPSIRGSVKPTYPCGVCAASVEKYMPDFITDSLRAGISDFDDWMRGFYYPDAILTGAETRSTSPIRVIRNENYMCPTLEGLYPIGEGAGYAGGIVSSATDGVRVAESIILNN